MKNTIFSLSDATQDALITIEEHIDQEMLIGKLISNRIVNIAYDRLDFSGMNRELKKGLKIIYDSNVRKTRIFLENLKYVSTILSDVGFKYAFLKGAYLTTCVYKLGYRTSNDIDILINPNDVSKLQQELLKNGFIQGQFNDSKQIIPATRKEIVFAKVNTGQTIPFVKVINGNPVEIDINFSVDYKSGEDNLVNDLLENRVKVKCDNFEFFTLNTVDFFIHLCCHLYKEATTYDWVKMKRDLSLYKFSDINVFLKKHASQGFFNALATRILQLGVEKECYYTLTNSFFIYPEFKEISNLNTLIERICKADKSFMKQIIHPAKKQVYYYDMEFIDWFFCLNKTDKLRIVENEGS